MPCIRRHEPVLVSGRCRSRQWTNRPRWICPHQCRHTRSETTPHHSPLSSPEMPGCLSVAHCHWKPTPHRRHYRNNTSSQSIIISRLQKTPCNTIHGSVQWLRHAHMCHVLCEPFSLTHLSLKIRHSTFGHNIDRCRPIFNIFSLTDVIDFHITSTALLHCLKWSAQNVHL